MLKAWASKKSFRPKGSWDEGPGNGPGEPPGRNGEVDFRKTKRSNATHASTTDKDARLFRKGAGQESRLAYLGVSVRRRPPCCEGAGLEGCDRRASFKVMRRWMGRFSGSNADGVGTGMKRLGSSKRR
jgi:hypothetical protein